MDNLSAVESVFLAALDRGIHARDAIHAARSRPAPHANRSTYVSSPNTASSWS